MVRHVLISLLLVSGRTETVPMGTGFHHAPSQGLERQQEIPNGSRSDSLLMFFVLLPLIFFLPLSLCVFEFSTGC